MTYTFYVGLIIAVLLVSGCALVVCKDIKSLGYLVLVMFGVLFVVALLALNNSIKTGYAEELRAVEIETTPRKSFNEWIKELRDIEPETSPYNRLEKLKREQ